eukprot:TRINITY_DN9228_c0_g1_i6.p2 TRINITY_DN9228_c0_g1~~TRINITY_DN9228_c0_g1_i6.p2  ORF type:complete len:175 (+),score=53.58 TRINITY_DN9228_c0_g1_i6:137-661(+)
MCIRDSINAEYGGNSFGFDGMASPKATSHKLHVHVGLGMSNGSKDLVPGCRAAYGQDPFEHIDFSPRPDWSPAFRRNELYMARSKKYKILRLTELWASKKNRALGAFCRQVWGALETLMLMRAVGELKKMVHQCRDARRRAFRPVSYTHLRAHETPEHLVCRLLLEKKKKKTKR